MIKQLKSIKSFTSTSNNKAFLLEIENNGSTQFEMYYANIEQATNNSDKYFNKNCLIANNNDELYSSIYCLNNLYLKSALYNKTVDSNLPDSRNFQNIYNYRDNSLLTSIINQIQVGDTIYQLNGLKSLGKNTILSDVYYWHLTNYLSTLPNVHLSTILYDYSNVNTATSINDLNIDTINSNKLSKVEYNQIIEIPGHAKNDYDSGQYAANIYKTKNELNSLYSMSHNDFVTNLINARKYIAIDHCNDQVYLKYYDNINYNNNTKTESDNCMNNLNFQKIEVLASLNRYEYTQTHKTNYYDVDIVCEKIFESLNNINNENKDKIKNTLKTEIANIISDICKQVAPVDTQLVQVNVLENETDI